MTTTMNVGDINARLGLSGNPLTSKLLTESLGFEPVETQGRAMLFAESDYPAMCRAFAKWIEGRASAPMPPKVEKPKKGNKTTAPPPAGDDDDEEL